jgi:uncharacterized membrane protein YkgB
MGLMKQILTGSDNQTYAIGRILGIVQFGVFLIILPIAAWVGLSKGWVDGASLQTLFGSLTTYVPAVAVSVAAMIGLTHFAEPKPKSGDDRSEG